MHTNKRKLLAGIFVTLSLATSSALAQSFPSKPLRIIHGGPPGGGLDAFSRIIGDAVAPKMGQPVVIEAKPGGSGTLATHAFLAAAQDGHTVMVSMDSLVTELPHSLKTSYDPFKDLTPLVEIYTTGLFLVAHPDVPANNVAELIEHIKTKPRGSFGYASYSTGTMSHALGMMLAKSAGIEITHVPYKGTPPAIQDVVGGHIPIGFVGSVPLPPLVQSGQIKLLAYTGSTRALRFPDVPTFAEAGYPDVTATVGIVMFATPTMAVEAREKWRDAVTSAMKDQNVIERFAALGQLPAPSRSPEEISKAYLETYERLGEIFNPAAAR